MSVSDDFFELGGHSLMLMQITSRILNRFDIEIPMWVFFEAPTIAELAIILGEMIDYLKGSPKTQPHVVDQGQDSAN